VIRRNHHTGELSLDPLRWGLIPYWCEDPKGGRRPINAKCETVRRRNERKAVGQVEPVAAYQANAAPLATGQDPEAVVLDLVNPSGAWRRPID
jgi:hypothetical protein